MKFNNAQIGLTVLFSLGLAGCPFGNSANPYGDDTDLSRMPEVGEFSNGGSSSQKPKTLLEQCGNLQDEYTSRLNQLQAECNQEIQTLHQSNEQNVAEMQSRMRTLADSLSSANSSHAEVYQGLKAIHDQCLSQNAELQNKVTEITTAQNQLVDQLNAPRPLEFKGEFIYRVAAQAQNAVHMSTQSFDIIAGETNPAILTLKFMDLTQGSLVESVTIKRNQFAVLKPDLDKKTKDFVDKLNLQFDKSEQKLTVLFPAVRDADFGLSNEVPAVRFSLLIEPKMQSANVGQSVSREVFLTIWQNEIGKRVKSQITGMSTAVEVNP